MKAIQLIQKFEAKAKDVVPYQDQLHKVSWDLFDEIDLDCSITTTLEDVSDIITNHFMRDSEYLGGMAEVLLNIVQMENK